MLVFCILKVSCSLLDFHLTGEILSEKYFHDSTNKILQWYQSSTMMDDQEKKDNFAKTSTDTQLFLFDICQTINRHVIGLVSKVAFYNLHKSIKKPDEQPLALMISGLQYTVNVEALKMTYFLEKKYWVKFLSSPLEDLEKIFPEKTITMNNETSSLNPYYHSRTSPEEEENPRVTSSKDCDSNFSPWEEAHRQEEIDPEEEDEPNEPGEEDLQTGQNDTVLTSQEEDLKLSSRNDVVPCKLDDLVSGVTAQVPFSTCSGNNAIPMKRDNSILVLDRVNQPVHNFWSMPRRNTTTSFQDALAQFVNHSAPTQSGDIQPINLYYKPKLK
jgi:hypothetical protein